jgi:hypothetical protein
VEGKRNWCKRTCAGLLVLLGLSLGLRLWPIDHGLPRSYVPDTHVVRNALGMARDRDPVPPANAYSSYPYLVAYMLLPVYAGEYAAGRALGAWGGAQEFGMRAVEDPAISQLPARILVAVLGALTPLAIFGAARAAGLKLGAWVAAWLAATSLLHVQFSTQERPWVPLVFFGALAAWASLVHARDGSARSLVLGGLAAGLAFACHQAGLAMLALPGLAWLGSPRGWRGAELQRRLAHGVACVALFAVAGLVLGYPYYLRYGPVPDAAMIGGEQAQGKLSIGAQSIVFGVSMDSLRRLSAALAGYDPVLVILGLAGIVLAFRRPVLRPLAIFVAAWGAFFMTNPSDHVRYLLPLVTLGAVPAGLAAERLASRAGGRVALGALLVVPLVQAVRFDLVLAREDTRAEAERKLEGMGEGARIAIDHYGAQVELSQVALERLAGVRVLRTREAHRLERLRAGAVTGGVDAIAVEDLFEVDPESGEYGVREEVQWLGDEPGEVFARLGVTHLLLVERRSHVDEPRPLQGLVEGGREVFIVSPAGGRERPREAFLPTEMDFPLTALWRVERPGPFMASYEL